ncbi:PucR family transcriptional regulator [Alkalihalobacillus deserti]|uniref:PucR family transcriptional regulator n=1 Tax=Alkalihalobacillus deserti TaxID=2879466 RepID=UPI001D1328AA|nr:PucR family transcriptional regulator [Alkalihalobacillus deserti]
MSITMMDVQSLAIFKDSSIRTGTQKLETTYVNWVSVIETPVESFVRENELVLTSGVGCGHDQELFYSFVHDVINSGASALAIALGPFVDKIPPPVINLALQNDFILIELDWSVRFSDILEQVLEQIHEKKRQYFDKIETIRKSLLHCILSGQSLDVVAEHFSSSIGCEVFIADKRGVIRGKCHDVAEDLQNRWILFMQEQLEEDGIYHSLGNTFEWLPYSGGYALQLTIHSAGNIQGYIVVGGFSAEPFTEEEHKEWVMLLEHATTAVAIHFLHEQAAKEAEWRLRDDFVWELTRGSIHSQESMLSRSKSLGYQMNLPYICVVAKPDQLRQSFQSITHLTITFDHWLHECIRHMEEEAESVAKSMALKSMVTYQQEELIIFLEVNHQNANQQTRTYITKLVSRFYYLYPTITLTWGIAKQYGYSCFTSSYQEAKRALEIGRKRKSSNAISTFADTTADRIIENLLKNDELIDIASSVLDSLLRYSEERHINLLHTFTTYHHNRGNVSQTARELNLHRQSLLYRLRKIETLTNCSLDDADDLFILDLSTRLWLNGMKTNDD